MSRSASINPGTPGEHSPFLCICIAEGEKFDAQAHLFLRFMTPTMLRTLANELEIANAIHEAALGQKKSLETLEQTA